MVQNLLLCKQKMYTAHMLECRAPMVHILRMAHRTTYSTPYVQWMHRHGLTHPAAALILGISERTSKQYAAGKSAANGRPIELPEPIRKLMAAKDEGYVWDALPLTLSGKTTASRRALEGVG